MSNIIDAAPAELQIGMPLVLTWQAWAAHHTQLPLFRKRPAPAESA